MAYTRNIVLSKDLPYHVEWHKQLPHIAAIDLANNGIGIECAVVSIDANNLDLYFIRSDSLDRIDKERLLQILRRSNAKDYSLWEIMSQFPLPNGMNALEFFHQLTKVRTYTGEIVNATSGKRGRNLTNAEREKIQLRRKGNSVARPAVVTEYPASPSVSELSEQQDVSQSAANVRKPGRPPKSK